MLCAERLTGPGKSGSGNRLLRPLVSARTAIVGFSVGGDLTLHAFPLERSFGIVDLGGVVPNDVSDIGDVVGSDSRRAVLWK
jgi:hypothetical protein